MPKSQIVIDVPKFPVVRSRFLDERHVALDLRGIRNPHRPMNGRLNPSKGNTRPKYLTAEQLEARINEYWESCMGPTWDKNGNLLRDSYGNVVKVQTCPYTVSGLALYLGISTQTLKEYKEGKVETLLDEMRADTDDVKTFASVVSQARQRIESYAERRLYDRDGQRGGQFVLDNCFKWYEGRTAAEIDKTYTEIKKMLEELEIKKKELEIKRKLIEDGDEDDQLTINIIRGRKENDE